MTVALPMYRSKRIAWLALESLARQEDVNFEWELVVAEEREHAFRERNVRCYEEGLRRAGCVRIHYIGLKKWIPLPMKWRLIARNASRSSSIFMLHAADCYSPPRRLRETFDLMSDPEVDWCQTNDGALYHIRHRKTLRFDASMEGYDHPCAYFMALRTRLARRLPPSDAERIIDRWLFTQATAIKGSPLKVAGGKDWWKGGLETKGLNCISLLDEFVLNPSIPFRPDHEDLLRYIPPDIRARLEALSESRIPDDAERLRRMEKNLRQRKRRLSPGKNSPT